MFWVFSLAIMNSDLTYIIDIVAGKIDWKFEARVIHLWKVPNMKNMDEDVAIEFLLLDEKVWDLLIL